MDEERIDRFGDDFNFLSTAKLPALVNNNSYFVHTEVDSRMNDIRKSIERIRKNWKEYDYFVDLAYQLIIDYNNDNKNDEYVKDFFKVLSKRRNWFDISIDGFNTPENYDVINAFTSKNHFGKIFSPMNNIYRDRDKSKKIEFLDGATFINEVINIDLYNYINSNNEVNNFTGIVYRGMNLPEDIVNSIKKITSLSIDDRMIAIPLDMQSSSTNINIAKSFIKYRLDKYVNDLGVLWKIHVTSLDKDDIDLYQEKYSSGKLSSLCAVPIMDLSEYKKEDEVLLRGAFYYVLDVYDSPIIRINGKPVVIIESLMLNTNRDHLSTTLNLDHNARKLMFSLVAKKRHQFCSKFFSKNDEELSFLHKTRVQKQKEEIEKLLKV